MTKASELTVSGRQLQIVLMFFTGNVLQNPSAFSIIKSCVVVPVKALKESGAPGQMQAAKGSGCAGRARRRLCAAKQHLSKGEYDYDLFAASTEYVPDHQRS
ncbi:MULTISPECIES: hypothetical protein [Faecalibacterium]|jgi:hypothetical protein|uniref:hypothetical protein n=1 Tax=Faecalibacterium TaxID=216851 RepID=UPI0015CF7B10|nr:hypothetical protein [Faecalibacterium prausnitzii]